MKKILFILLFPLLLMAQTKESYQNSRNATIDSLGTWTGTVEDASLYNNLIINCKSDINGIIKVYFYKDKQTSTIYSYDIHNYLANDTTDNQYIMPLATQYFKISFANSDTVAGTLNLLSMLTTNVVPNNDIAYHFVSYTDTVAIADTIAIPCSQWSKITIQPLSATDSLQFSVGDTTASVLQIVLPSETVTTEKLNKAYFPKLFIHPYGLGVKSYRVIIEGF